VRQSSPRVVVVVVVRDVHSKKQMIIMIGVKVVFEMIPQIIMPRHNNKNSPYRSKKIRDNNKNVYIVSSLYIVRRRRHHRLTATDTVTEMISPKLRQR